MIIASTASQETRVLFLALRLAGNCSLAALPGRDARCRGLCLLLCPPAVVPRLSKPLPGHKIPQTNPKGKEVVTKLDGMCFQPHRSTPAGDAAKC